MRGTMGGAPDLSCRGCGLCDRGHWRRSFRLRDLSKKLCSHLAQVQDSLYVNSLYPFAAKLPYVAGVRIAASGGAEVNQLVPFA